MRGFVFSRGPFLAAIVLAAAAWACSETAPAPEAIGTAGELRGVERAGGGSGQPFRWRRGRRAVDGQRIEDQDVVCWA